MEVTLLTDPYENEVSLRFPRTLTPDILVLSHQQRARFSLDSIQGTPCVISDPGEYEVKGVLVQGLQDPSVERGSKERAIIYRFSLEGLALGFLGQINRKLTDMELEGLGNIDILLLPVGGGQALDAKLASDIIADIEPRIVVPLYYELPGLKIKLASVDAFCKSFGARHRENFAKLKMTKKDLPHEELLVAVLERA